MKYDTYNKKERAQQPLGITVVKTIYGNCPICTAQVECRIGRLKHKITYCESCGQKIVWEVRK